MSVLIADVTYGTSQPNWLLSKNTKQQPNMNEIGNIYTYK